MTRIAALLLLLALAFAAPARADCQTQLTDAAGSCGCLFCPVFFVPAFCCAQAADSSDNRQFCGNLLNGGCVCWRIIGVDGPIVRAAEVPPPATLPSRAIAY